MTELHERFRRAGAAPPSRAPIRFGVRRRIAGFCAATLGLAVIALAALAIGLRSGDAPLSFLIPIIEKAASAELGGGRVKIGAVLLRFDPASGPGLRFRDVRLIGADGVERAAAPNARVSFSTTALLRGAVRPRAITLVGAQAVLRRDPEGRFTLGLGDSAVQADGPDPGEAFADAMGRAGPLADLESVVFENARLAYRDAISGRDWVAEDADFSIMRDASGLRAAVAARLADGLFGGAALRAEGTRNEAGGVAASLSFERVAPAELAAQFPALAAFKALDAPLSGDAAFAIDPAGALLDFDGVLEAGAGEALVEGMRVAVERARFDFAFDPARDRFDVTEARLETGLGALSLHGIIDAAEDSAVAQLEISALRIASESLFPEPVSFDGGRLVARAFFDPLRVEIAEAHLRRGPVLIDASGEVFWRDETDWKADLTLTGREVDAAALKALWPIPAAPGARAWVRENLDSGHVDRFDLIARLTPESEDLSVSFAFEKARAHYFRPLPPIVDAAGWGEVNLDTLALVLASGEVRPDGGGVVTLDGSSMRMPDLDDPLSTAFVEVRGGGPIAAILETLDIEPLGYPSALGLAPRSVEGRAEAVATLTLPLLRDLRLDQIDIGVDASVFDVALTPPGLDRRFTAHALTIAVDTESLALSGAGALDGAPLDVVWRETFQPEPGAPSSRFDVSTIVTPARAAAFGVDADGRFSGSAQINAVIEVRDAAGARIALDADLVNAALTIDELGWSKPSGAAGRLFLTVDTARETALDAIALDAPGLSVRGSALLDEAGAVSALTLSRLQLRDEADVALRLKRDASGLSVDVSGALLDLAALSDRMGESGGAGGAGPVRVSLEVETLRFGSQIVIADARGGVNIAQDGQIDARLRGLTGGSAPAQLIYTRGEAGERVRLTARDAGAFLRKTEFFSDGLGGRLGVEAEIIRDAGFALEGVARIEDITVVDDPALRRLLAEARLDEAERRLAKEGGIDFERARVAFSLRGATLELRDAVAVGPTIGVTLSGTYDVERDALDLAGVFTPLYTVNSAVGAIPLIGGLLTGGEGEGLFGVNFALVGSASDPTFAVNAFSLLTPGVLRRLLSAGAADPDAAETRRLREQRRED